MSDKPKDQKVVPPPKPSRPWGQPVTRWFFTGLVIAGPVGITLYVAWWVINAVDGLVKPLIPPQYQPDAYLPFNIPGFGLLVAIVTITVVGFFAANFLGRQLLQLSESILHRVPLVSVLYRGLKQIFETVVNKENQSFKNVGLIQYPRPGIWALVLISTTAKGEVNEKVDGEEIYSCFLPTTPNPTSGFLLFVPKSEIQILDMGTEDAAKLIISAGLVAPEYHKKTAELAEYVDAAETKSKK